MIKITIDKNSIKEISGLLDEGVKSIKDWSKPFKKFGVLLREEQKKNFDLQGAIYQGGDFIRVGGAFANSSFATTRRSSWTPLTEGTRKDRVREGYNGARPILVRTGKLRGGFTSSVTKNSFTTENKNELAPYHQFGSDKMPARRILGISKKSAAALVMVIENHIAGALKFQSFKKGFTVLR